ncbi:phosphatase domain containing, paladin 1 [Ictidomys tridecemlineatus]|nr:phosphatase domain containing, paladin 1 [Ictidomys tridecemlineatus]
MGTTASTAQQTVPAGAPFEGLQGGGAVDGRPSLSVHSFQTMSVHNSKAKSIIPNKVAPVVITYNCREEFQIHDELLKAHYTLGRLSDATPEHYLVQGRYFLVRDVPEKVDVLGTSESCGAPNFRQGRGGFPVFGMGQPSLLGFRRVLQKLQKDGHKECVIFCVREEPVLFLRAGEDLVSYTPRDKQNLHENLRGLGPGSQAERLELTIQKEIHDFARLSGNTYHVYHSTGDLQGEPHAHGPPPALLFSCQSGVGRTNLGMVLGTLVLFHHSGTISQPEAVPPQTRPLPLEQFQVVQSFLCTAPQGRKVVEEVDRAIAACSELHDLKEEVLEGQRQLGATQSRAQGSGGQHDVRQRALRSLERYFYLILFNYYLHEQEADDLVSPDALSTIREMDVANFRRVPRMPIYGTAQPSAKALGSILAYLTDAKRKLRQVVWVNLRQEAVLQCDGHTHSLPLPGPALLPDQLEALETQLKAHLSSTSPDTKGPPSLRFQTCLTMREVFSQHHGACPGLTYHRIPVPDFCAPREETAIRRLGPSVGPTALVLPLPRVGVLKKDHKTKGQNTTLWEPGLRGTGPHLVSPCLREGQQGSAARAWPQAGVAVQRGLSQLPSLGTPPHCLSCAPPAPRAQVVMDVVQLLPDGHHMKKEVDAALDTVSETMTPMHYHLREIIICTYRQAKAAKEEQEARRLRLRSAQYLERYVYLILFNAYLHLEKAGSWQRPFSTWMREVASKAGVYEILDRLGFPELESLEDQPFSRLRHRWQEQNLGPEPSAAGDFL